MSNKTPMLSLYSSRKSQDNKDISITDYIHFVKHGTNQDLVLKARALKQSGDIEGYKSLKNESQLVTGSCTILPGAAKLATNIADMNGLIVIDLDKDQVTPDVFERLTHDPYTYIAHSSFGGGDNYCVFVRIDRNRFEDCFENLGQYYFEKYGLVIDQSCKNRNRLRYLSYDPDLFINEAAIRWKATKTKTTEVKKELTDYVFFEDDFSQIIGQIQQKSIDLVKGDYDRYMRIGFALYSQFGDAGEQYFIAINQFNPNQNKKRARREWEAFKSGGTCKIGTFYHYCREAGLELYSEKTKSIINCVKVSKATGVPTVESVTHNIVSQGYEISESDEVVIKHIIESKTDYSFLLNYEKKEIEVLENFILDAFSPRYNEIDKNLYINDGVRIEDREGADIFLSCKKNLDLKKDMTERNVELILMSSAVDRVNPVADFFEEHYTPDYEKGFIKEYADCIQPQNDFNYWCLKHWLVGAVFNWLRSIDGGHVGREVSPLTLLLVGGEQGIGKTSFVRGILPDELYNYCIEQKIDINNNDSKFRMATSLIMIDEEFGGKSVKDDKEFKAIADIEKIVLRRAYGRRDVNVSRICALAASSNEEQPLKDVTGNRRILPITTDSFDFEKMRKIDKIKLICEAYGLLMDGFDWKIYGEKKDHLNKNTLHNVAVIPFEEIFFNVFSLKETGYFDGEVIVNQGDIETYFKLQNMPASKWDIKDVLTKNKMKYKTSSLNGVRKSGLKLWVSMNNSIYNTWDASLRSAEEDVPF